MNSKQRVTAALTRKILPDRVPLQFDLCRSLLEGFGQQYGMSVQYNRAVYEDVTYRISANDLRTAMGSDCVVVGAGLPSGYEHPETNRRLHRQRVRHGDEARHPVLRRRRHAVQRPDDERAISAVSPFPIRLAEGRFTDAIRDIARFKDDFFIVGDLELTLFEMAWHMTGMEKFMVDMSSGEEYIGVLLDKVLEYSIGVGTQAGRTRCGRHLDGR